MERTVTVRTPESVAFHYELAGLGSRFLAVAIDLLIQVILAIAVGIVFGVAAVRAGDVSKALHLNGAQASSLVLAFLFIIFFLIFFGYFIIFESLWNGQTPGKRLMGIRVVRDGGYPIDLGSAVLRNLIRVLEVAFAYILSAILVLVSPQNKRIGDYAAGTIVVRDRVFEVSNPQTWLRGDDEVPSAAPIVTREALTQEEWALVDRYVERRTSLPPAVAALTATRVAATLRPKVGAAADSLTDDDLLLRLFASRRR